jgi:anti-sigma B factor antagonist
MSAHLSAVPSPTETVAPVEPAWTTRKGLLYIRTRNERGAWTLELDGELDASTAQALENEILVAERAEAEVVTIDLRGLEFMDSSGVRVLQRAQRRMGSADRLRILPGPRTVQKVFRLTRTESDLPFEDVEGGPAAA